MIDLGDVRRVRLHQGVLAHQTARGSTKCGKRVKLTGPAGRPHDQPLPADTPVTCRACQYAAEGDQ